MSTATKSALADMMSSVKTTYASAAQSLPLGKLAPDPDQPRNVFTPDSLETLTESVRKNGVLQPLLVRPYNEGYLIVAGERRYRAAKAAGLNRVPAVVRDLSDEEAFALAITENLNREDLNPVEETDAVLRLLSISLDSDKPTAISLLRMAADEDRGRDTGIASDHLNSIREVFEALGRFSPAGFVANRLPLLKLPADVLQAVREGSLPYTKAIIVGRVKDPEKRAELLQRALAGASKRELTEAAKTSPASTPDQKAIKAVRSRLTPKRFAALSKDDAHKANKLMQELVKLLDAVVFD